MELMFCTPPFCVLSDGYMSCCMSFESMIELPDIYMHSLYSSLLCIKFMFFKSGRHHEFQMYHSRAASSTFDGEGCVS